MEDKPTSDTPNRLELPDTAAVTDPNMAEFSQQLSRMEIVADEVPVRDTKKKRNLVRFSEEKTIINPEAATEEEANNVPEAKRPKLDTAVVSSLSPEDNVALLQAVVPHSPPVMNVSHRPETEYEPPRKKYAKEVWPGKKN